MTKALPHVAILTSAYFPISHVSAKRPLYMAQELSRLGHRVTVFTCDWRQEGGPARSFEDGVVVERVDPRTWFPKFDPAAIPARLVRDGGGTWRARAETLRRMMTWGPYSEWGKQTLSLMLATHGKSPISVVWAIRGDDTSLEIAARFQKLRGVPWVADYKDPWDLFHPTFIRRTLQERVTRRRLMKASVLTETAQRQAVLDEQRFGRKAHFIPSGYNADQMRSAAPTRSSDAFSIVYVGHLQEIAHDLAALEKFMRLLGAQFPSAELHAFGRSHGTMEGVARAAGFTRLRLHSFVSEEKAFGVMKGSDALLVLPMTRRKERSAVGVKEFEYVASGTPVLCLGPPGQELGAFANATNFIEVNLDRGDHVVEVLRELVDAHAAGKRSRYAGPVNSDEIQKMSWSHLAKDLSRVLVEAAAVAVGTK